MCSFLDSWSVEVQTELLQINIVVKNVQFSKLDLSAKKNPRSLVFTLLLQLPEQFKLQSKALCLIKLTRQ